MKIIKVVLCVELKLILVTHLNLLVKYNSIHKNVSDNYDKQIIMKYLIKHIIINNTNL